MGYYDPLIMYSSREHRISNQSNQCINYSIHLEEVKSLPSIARLVKPDTIDQSIDQSINLDIAQS